MKIQNTTSLGKLNWKISASNLGAKLSILTSERAQRPNEGQTKANQWPYILVKRIATKNNNTCSKIILNE